MQLFGDLESHGALPRTLEARARHGREVVLLITDHRQHRWAANLLLNLEELSIRHHLVLADAPTTCDALDSLVGHAVAVGCAHFSATRSRTSSTLRDCAFSGS